MAASMNAPHNPHRRQRGTTLLEALVAFLVLSLGMLSVARVQTQLRLHADVARQRAEAVRLGQEDMERLRAFAVIAHSAGERAYADIASASTAVDAEAGFATNTRYVVTRQIDSTALSHAKSAAVTVGWTDRSGSAQQVVLSSIIAESNPAYSGALGIAPTSAPVKGAFGRSVRIPLAAKDLGNGRSAWKPVALGTVALVFDNASGQVTSRCTGVSSALGTAGLTQDALAACDALVGHLLTGSVRFSQASPPNPATANDAPLAFDIALALTGGSYSHAPQCATEWVASSSDRYANYHCVVYPLATGQWAGRSNLVPIGWRIGAGASDRRVCRYSADLDASGAVDRNIEHPASYSAVDTSLANQNFLVIGGAEACPAASAVTPSGSAGDLLADLGTAPHQP